MRPWGIKRSLLTLFYLWDAEICKIKNTIFTPLLRVVYYMYSLLFLLFYTLLFLWDAQYCKNN